MPKSPEKPTSAVRPRTTEVSPSRIKPTFLCFFCKIEFHSRTELIKHQDRCDSVPSDLRSKAADRVKSSQDECHAKSPAKLKPSCEKFTVPSPERRRTRSENLDESPAPSGETTKSVQPAKTRDAVKSTGSMKTRDAAKSVEPIKTREAGKNVEPVKTREGGRTSEFKTRDVAKNAEPVKTRETAKTVEPMKLRDAARSAVPTKTRDTVKSAEAMKSRDAAKSAEAAKTRDAAKSSEPKTLGKSSESLKTRDALKSLELMKSREPVTSEINSESDKSKKTVKPKLYMPKPGPKSSKDHAVRRALLGKPLVSKERFVDSLYLVPVAKVKDIEEEQEKHHNEIIEIDLTDESDTLPPKSPRTPCTPSQKLLLSFDTSQSQTKATDESSSDSDDDTKATTHSNHHYHSIPTNKTLLSIALSSNLGLKLKHLVDDVVEHSNRDRNYEQFCKTPMKNSFQERLRYREMPVVPITFRKNKHYRTYYHTYRFTKKQKEEFMRTVTTGLNRKSRNLYRSLPRSKVKLKRLNHWDIKRLSKVKPKPTFKQFAVGDMNQWRNRQPNILRRMPNKLSPAQSQIAAKSALAAALLRAPPRLDNVSVTNDHVRPIGMFMNIYAQQQQQQQQKQQQFAPYQPKFVWNQPNPNRAVAQVSPIMKPTAVVQSLPPKTPAAARSSARQQDKMREEKIDDDISIVVPADDCITVSSDDDSPRRKRPLNAPSLVPPKSARLIVPPTQNKSFCTSLLNLPSPTKRVISAAAKNEPPEARTFLFRCHLCGLEERHKVSQSKDIYKHLHSSHRGEVIHIVDYKLHGEVHLVEAMSQPPTVMKTAPEVAQCGDELNAAGPSAAGRRSSRNVQSVNAARAKPDMVICIDE